MGILGDSCLFFRFEGDNMNHLELKSILQCFSFDTGTLHAFHPEDQHLHLMAAEGLPEAMLEKIQCIPLGKGIAGTAAATRKPVSICNLQTDSAAFIPPQARTSAVQGSLCIPLLRNDQLMGTLGVGWKGSRKLTEAEEDQLLSIGSLLAEKL